MYLNYMKNMEFGRKILVYKSMAGFLEVEKESMKMKVVYRKDSFQFNSFLTLPPASKLKYVRS